MFNYFSEPKTFKLKCVTFSKSHAQSKFVFGVQFWQKISDYSFSEFFNFISAKMIFNI